MPRKIFTVSDHEKKAFDEYVKSKATAKQISAKRNIPKARFKKVAEHIIGTAAYQEMELARKPKQTPYKLGRSLEYSVASAFRDAGFWTIRAAQSRGEADIVAIRKGDVFLIQCKRGGSISSQEWNDLHLLAERLGATAVVADRRTGRGVNYAILTGFHGDPDSYIDYVPV